MPKYFNSTNQPAVYNDDGQTAGGAEWFESPETHIISQGIEDGTFVVQDEPKEDDTKTKSNSNKESSFPASK